MSRTTTRPVATLPPPASGGGGEGARPNLDRRADYSPRARVEQFIVPLLAQAIPAAIQTYAPKANKGAALDVGCGRQPFRSLIQSLGLSYTGLDTQQNADNSVDVIAPIDKLLPPDLTSRGPFSLILCTEVLEHVADWNAAFANIAALTARSGRIIITCPHVYRLHEEPFDFWRPTPHAIEFFAQRHNLRILELQKLGSGWDVLGTVLASFSPRPVSGPAAALGLIPAFLTRLARSAAFSIIRTRLLQRLVRDSGPQYLSNLAVLERP